MVPRPGRARTTFEWLTHSSRIETKKGGKIEELNKTKPTSPKMAGFDWTIRGRI